MSTRSFNVFSERIVVWPGESFQFVVHHDGQAQAKELKLRSPAFH